MLAGASAGAIIALQAEFDITNGKPLSSVLPEDFNYKGIMSFSGAAYCFDWNLRFAKEPCPIAFFHGTDDTIVPYRKISFLQVSMKGSDALVETMEKSGYNNYNIYRFPDHGHEIAVNMGISYPEEMRFLEENVIRGRVRTVDAFVYDPAIPTPEWESNGFKQLYKLPRRRIGEASLPEISCSRKQGNQYQGRINISNAEKVKYGPAKN